MVESSKPAAMWHSCLSTDAEHKLKGTGLLVMAFLIIDDPSPVLRVIYIKYSNRLVVLAINPKQAFSQSFQFQVASEYVAVL